MATKPCKECNWQISAEAPTCPFCGKRSPTGGALRRVAGGAAAGLMMLIAIPVVLAATSDASKPTADPTRPSGGVTMAAYQQLQPGMSHAQVAQILGEQGEVMTHGEVDGVESAMYLWSGSANAGGSMNATFQGGRLVNKSQIGLR